MTGNEFLCAQLALKCWQDGFSEGLSGMLAIGFCIRNRTRSQWYGGSWADVLSHHQEWSAKIESYPPTIPDPRSHAFQMLLHEITDIFNGTREDNITIARDSIRNSINIGPPPAPALYYGVLGQISNPWFEENISQKGQEHPRIASVGALSFFA